MARANRMTFKRGTYS